MNPSNFGVLGFRFAIALGLFLMLGAVAPKASAAAIPDAWITTKAKIALVTRAGASAANVHVDTVDGRVVLYGKVGTDLQKQTAEAAVRALEGVQWVRNLLQVVPPALEPAIDLSDARIRDDVESVLREDPSLASSHISVKSVDLGEVLLTGRAKTVFAHWAAVAAASSVPGVRSVATEIKVPDEVPTESALVRAASGVKDAARDSWTTVDVKLRLLADAEVPALDVGVDTHYGVVSLVGMVPTDAAKAAAIADAQKVDLVVGVNDDLQVVPGIGKPIEAEDDGVIKLHLTSMLQDSPEFARVDADVKDGRVHLTGAVASGWERLRVATMVRATKGVRSVDDDLRVARSGD
jgi:osmotically-inducible protein OsmY